MSKLPHLQNKFQEFLMSLNPDIYESIVSTDKVSAERRLAIYKNAYQARLVDALASNFPALKAYLGSRQFEDLAYAYLEKYPSQFRSIRWFGDELVSFLKVHPIYQLLPFLAELALVEWTMTLVFDAGDSPLFQLESIKNIPEEAWARMRFELHPSVHLLRLSWNIIPLWQALIEELAPVEPQYSAKPRAWLFWRQDLVSRYCSLEEDEAWAIEALLNFSNFGELCEGLGQWQEEDAVALRAASLLKGWISAGLISEIII